MTMTGFEEKAEEKIKAAAEEKIKDAPKDIKLKVKQNVWGWLCTKSGMSEANQNRCKALERLPDIAQSGAKAVGSCTVAAGAGAAEVGTDGLATPVAAPVGFASAGSCLYNSAATADSASAMYTQLKTGKETKTLAEQGQDYAGTLIEKKWQDWKDKTAYEIQSSELRHAQEADPGLTAEDFNNANDAWDNLGH